VTQKLKILLYYEYYNYNLKRPIYNEPPIYLVWSGQEHIYHIFSNLHIVPVIIELYLMQLYYFNIEELFILKII